MRAIFALIVVIGLALVVIYYAGGSSSFDASEQGRTAKAALSPGMPFGPACDITGDPRKFQIINRKVRRIRGEEIISLVPASPVKVTRERINERLAEGSLPYGFQCTFTYSNQVGFIVTYDNDGAVASVRDAVTMSTLLDQ